MAGRDEVELLLLLKGTVEGLLISQVANVWSIYGGLNRLHCAMERIFKHGYQISDQDGEPDLWVFINGLSWLQPNLATSPTLVLESYKESSHVPQHIISDKALTWLYKSLETHTLSQKLSWLLSDREHLLSCYSSSAFLSQEKFGEAALICLRAVEHNQPTLLTEINPCLYMTKWNPKILKTHRRCSSYPETLERNSLWAKATTKATMGIISSRCEEGQELDVAQVVNEATTLSQTPNVNKEPVKTEHIMEVKNVEDVVKIIEPKNESLKISFDKIKAWNSLPSLIDIGLNRGNDDSNNTPTKKSLHLTRSNSSRSTKGHSGSQTLPSTPYRSVKCISDTPNRSSTVESKLFALEKATGVSKLSPSVIQVDYSGLQHSDSPDMPKQSRPVVGKKIHSTKPSAAKNLTKSLNKRGKVLKMSTPLKAVSGSGDPPRDVSNIPSHVGKGQAPIPEVKSRPKSTETAIPSKMVRSMTCDRMTPIKSPPMLSPSSDMRRPGSASSLWDGGKASSSTNLGTPMSWSRKSFMEDGGSSVQPMSTGYFPRPVKGQSLFSFLSSGQFSRANAELDRENAHFSISEAMIAAIEQVKCNKESQASPAQEDGADESDEEIINLKQRLRLRRHQRQEERRRLVWGVTLLSDGKTDTTTTDQSISPPSTPPGTPSDSISTDGVEDMELDDVQNILALKDSGLSVSMASLYSESELAKNTSQDVPANTAQDSNWSAESVALSLISQFSEKQLPRASDLKWLVSEQEVDQQLLPLPKSWPVSPDDADEDMRQATPLRGNMEWAPPRPQVIFTLHPNPVRRTLMAKQSYRCAGCGMKVAPSYAHRFRYCEYLGRYFCTGCHSNQSAAIPARVLTKWDFTRYPVSNFSYRLLDSMFMDPLFDVLTHNSGLYRKARALDRCRKFRLQLHYLKDLIFNCRFAKELQEVLEREPPYMFSEIDVYSMMDFEQVKQGELASRLQTLLALGNEHTSQCELCLARGFVCELCTSKEIIFPWQIARVSQCKDCGACYHTKCLSPSACPRCKRISERLKKNQESKVQDDELDVVS
ncbi:hypothetical protein ONE63_004109 [Megalurothrips usitatus]|uniref:RUN domain-containing protein n=1 Tax=Megalurothrips usitatus TaxID=439358 RepID=A0AAV7X5R1_9NEOP|nr:hypothetical protein ONE63_004109 [Megalurothrips usitatus]